MNYVWLISNLFDFLSHVVLLNLGLWVKDLKVFDRKFGFYKEMPVFFALC